MPNLKELNQEVNALMTEVISGFKQNNISLIMPTYVPQRGEILREFANHGVQTFIAGGYQNARTFKEVPQKGLPEDTMGYISSFPKHISKAIADVIPQELLQDKKVAIFAYEVDFKWGELIKKRNLNTQIVGSVEQTQRGYFEEKGNLTHILDVAGLKAYKIPTRKVSGQTTIDELIEIYEQIKNEEGKVVVQDCCSESSNTAGKGTMFFEDCIAFVKNIKETGTTRKVARFISGFESNLSFFAGNMLPSTEMHGAQKIELSADMDRFDTHTLEALTQKAKSAGINENNIIALVGRGTLKAVGDENLTSCESNGVGNDVGFVYDKALRNKINEVGRKLSTTMALAGHVGLAGADLIIDKNNQVWINEINDRQQGPTAQMAKDADERGIPSLLKISLLSSYADFNAPKVQSTFHKLKEASATINEAYATNAGEFYLKVHSTHPKGQKQIVKGNLRPGFYEVKQNEQGKWALDFASYKNPNSSTQYQTNPSTGKVVVKLVGGDWKTGDVVDNGSQLFRLTGITDSQNPPFVVEDGKTKLNESWKPVVAAFYNHLFDAKYHLKNPLYQKRHAAKNQAIGGIVQSLRSR